VSRHQDHSSRRRVRPTHLVDGEASGSREIRPNHPTVDPLTRLDDESQLIARLKVLDDGAIRQVYHLYSDQVYRFAVYQSGDSALAADITAEVFLRLIETIGSYEYRGVPLSGWLFRTARNLIVDHQRRGNRLRPLEAASESQLISENQIELAELRLDGAELRRILIERDHRPSGRNY
jgi:DNA-directed RNA polymerase specialized sigma24 family protein